MNTCMHCSDADNLLGFTLEDGSLLELRFDVENAELDLRLICRKDGVDIDESIKINFCPFCGKNITQ